MSFQELAILLPCHSLEDFPQHHEGQEADGLLANWTALWHPRLLACQQTGPAWYRADAPPDVLDSKLILVPSVSEPELPDEFAARASDAGACLIPGCCDRLVILERALHAAGLQDDVDQQLVADFFALGYCYLQIQLLTRQMRYSSNLDDRHFFEQVLTAARAATAGESDAAHSKVAACFDLLAEERDHYYSVDAYLLDLTLLDESLVAAGPQLSWHSRMEPAVASNLLASAQSLERLSALHPETLELVRQSCQAGQLGIVGGEYRECRLPLLSAETVLAQLQQGRASYETLLGKAPAVFGRRRFGLTPLLPQILNRMGYLGALHFTLDDGAFPQGAQVKTRWEGCDGSATDAVAKSPLDASQPGPFLGLAQRLGESMDMDHVATLVFAHWPGRASVWYDDLRRCSKFGAALGRFITVEDYFRETYMPGHAERFSASRYVSPYLRQAAAAGQIDPLSSLAAYWQGQVERACLGGMSLLCAAVGAPPEEVAGDEAVGAAGGCAAEATNQLAAGFATRLPRGEQQQAGYLLLNPLSSARRELVDISDLASLPAEEKPIFAAAADGQRKWAIVDVPPMGFVWVSGCDSRPSRQRARTALVEDRERKDERLILRNEYFEAWVDTRSGALRSLKDYEHRSNRLSQQVALRRGAARRRSQREVPPAEYTTMAADSVAVTENNPLFGEVTTAGRLLGREKELLGEFQQTYRVVRGCRTLEVEIELGALAELGEDPWNSYYACRFAWADEAAEVSRNVHEFKHGSDSSRHECGCYFEIDTATTRTAVFPAGLPFHKQVGPRMIDSLLVVRGESARRFRFGIAIDPPNTLEQSRQWMAPLPVVEQSAGPPLPVASGWLFHFDTKSVTVTAWEPLFAGTTLVGARLRVAESMGRAVRTKLSCFRPIQSARRVDFSGESLGDCRVDGGRAQLDLSAAEWAAFEIWWSKN